MIATKADAAYTRLRRAIIVGEIPGDRPLEDSKLAEQFGFGRTPIREALKRLAGEQFLVWHPRTPPMVRDATVKEIYRLQEARLVLEEAVIRLSAHRITDRQLADLHDLVERLRQALLDGRAYDAVELDFAVHNAVAAGSDNQYLRDAIARLNSGSLRTWHENYVRIGHLAGEKDQHLEIVEALDSHDEEACAKAIRAHIFASLRLCVPEPLPGMSTDPDAIR